MAKQEVKTEPKKASAGYALFVFIGVLVIVLGGYLGLGAPIQPMFLLAWLFIYPVCMKLGHSFKDIETAMFDSIRGGLGPIFIVLTVGAMIAGWIAAGTVPTIIYVGLKLVSPKAFVPLTFVLCSLVSLSCGTAWGTAGTAGIAMFAVGEGLGVPTALTVGAIVSGSYLGDMLSPMSDSTNIVSAAARVDLITHCKRLAFPAIISYVITFVGYYLLGLKYAADALDVTVINETLAAISSSFNVSIITIIPLALLLVLLFMKKPAMMSMFISAVTGMVLAIVYQGLPVKSAIPFLWTGYKYAGDNAFLTTLLNRGGIQSMFSTVCILLFAFGVIGAFNKAGILNALIEPLVKKIKNPLQLTLVTQLVAFIGVIMGTNMFSLLMTGSLLSPAYDEFKLDRTMLTRAANGTATVICTLIPWNAAAIWNTGTFGISAFAYAPFALYSYVMPIVLILFSVFKIKVYPAQDAE